MFKPLHHLALGCEEFGAKVGDGNPERPAEVILGLNQGRER